MRDLASVAVVGGEGVGTLDLGWLGTICKQRTMPTYYITMFRMGYITICLDGKM